MRRLVAVVMFAVVVGWLGGVEAGCTTVTYVVNGQVMVCTTCCWGAAGCTVNCQ